MAESEEPGQGEVEGGSDPTPEELQLRLTADEIRIRRNELRLAESDKRFAAEEALIRRNRRLGLALAGLLVLTIAALVTSVIAVNRNIDSVAQAAPREASVGTAALKDGAVTGAKLARGSVDQGAIAGGAVGGAQLAEGAVDGRAIADGVVTAKDVAPKALTGATINESTLGAVPKADVAANASALGGLSSARYVSGVTIAEASSATSSVRVKGPITAGCPGGTSAIAGGARIDGSRDVAITTSTPDGRSSWRAEATSIKTSTGPWRLVVTVVCAKGG